MAAGDFTPSVLLKAQAPLSDVFQEPNSSDSTFNAPYEVARALLANQTASMDDLLTGNNCTGVRLYFMRGNSTSTLSAPDCATPTGPYGESFYKDYSNSILVGRTVKFRDDRCNNEIDFTREQSYQMRLLLSKLRTDLATVGTTKMAAWSQANLDPGIPASWDDTSETPRILMPLAEANWQSIGQMEATAQNNYFDNYFFISGRGGFFQDRWEAKFRRLNDNERSNEAAYLDMGLWYQDIRNLDAALGYSAAFAVNRNNYAFWNATFSPSIPTEQETNTWVYTMADPELKYMKNGRLVPVMYEIETTKVCLNRDAPSTKKVYEWVTWGRLLGGLENAPVGVNGENATLQWKIV